MGGPPLPLRDLPVEEWALPRGRQRDPAAHVGIRQPDGARGNADADHEAVVDVMHARRLDSAAQGDTEVKETEHAVRTLEVGRGGGPVETGA